MACLGWLQCKATLVCSAPMPLLAKSATGGLQVAALLQSGEDASVLDARGRPPYAVAANKEVRDAFRRHVANAGGELQWDVDAASIPSALTPEMEAQQAAKQVPAASQ